MDFVSEGAFLNVPRDCVSPRPVASICFLSHLVFFKETEDFWKWSLFEAQLISGDFGPGSPWTMSGDTGGYCKGARLTTGTQCVEARGVAEWRTAPRTAPPQEAVGPPRQAQSPAFSQASSRVCSSFSRFPAGAPVSSVPSTELLESP